MTRISSLCLAVCLFASSQLHAGLIAVEFDDFSTVPGPNVSVFTGGGFQINRTYSAAGIHSPVSGSDVVVGLGYVQLDYTITGGTFADFFNAYKSSPNAVFDGFRFNVNSFSGSSAEAQVRTGATIHQNVLVTGTGPFDLRFGTIPLNSNSVSLRFLNFGGSYQINSVSAVPEPTSMLMVGSALLGLCSFRRRR